MVGAAPGRQRRPAVESSERYEAFGSFARFRGEFGIPIGPIPAQETQESPENDSA
ncbi:hypothetical protein [Saccharibacillus kuerlensis]|uniref:Uncharacterized protein n=1 Tax=Saccharibacillus kuerlensis TaxID=459527 RepID=A0ABQ2L7Q2_9BACL|nr:hypothetical protein [Saccharibacillus kuerlensis]GGO06059.1 hypothetical protein GCM10010969_33050 [Saccharibacillus kuerlensis]